MKPKFNKGDKVLCLGFSRDGLIIKASSILTCIYLESKAYTGYLYILKCDQRLPYKKEDDFVKERLFEMIDMFGSFSINNLYKEDKLYFIHQIDELKAKACNILLNDVDEKVLEFQELYKKWGDEL